MMPLEKGAKPGTKGFGKNVKAEIKAGKPTKQAVAIAYSEARKKDAEGTPDDPEYERQRSKKGRQGPGTKSDPEYKKNKGSGGEGTSSDPYHRAPNGQFDRIGLRVSKDATGAVHVFLPNSVNYRGLGRTLARGFADRKPRKDGLNPSQKAALAELEHKAKSDFMTPEDRERLVRLRKINGHPNPKGRDRKRAKDMPKENFEQLKKLLTEFLSEEEREPEHQTDCSGHKDCGCGCKH